MSADLHLLKRGGIYYWRRWIPRSFAPGFGNSHILLSLRVREPASARRLGRRQSVIFDEAMQAIELEERTLSIQELKPILKRLYSLILDRCEREVANSYDVEEIPEEAFDNPRLSTSWDRQTKRRGLPPTKRHTCSEIQPSGQRHSGGTSTRTD